MPDTKARTVPSGHRAAKVAGKLLEELRLGWLNEDSRNTLS